MNSSRLDASFGAPSRRTFLLGSAGLAVAAVPVLVAGSAQGKAGRTPPATAEQWLREHQPTALKQPAPSAAFTLD